MINRLFPFIVLITALIFSLNFSSTLKDSVLEFSNSIKSKYVNFLNSIEFKIDKHFNQEEEIERLKAKVEKLEPAALLSIAFASKFNKLLSDINLTSHHPQLYPVKGISYANLSDYSKVWLEFPYFDKSKIYGLLYQGYSAGIVVEKNGKPLALLYGDKRSIFSVFIGNNDIPGVAFGNKQNILIKYIPSWMDPEIGNEVVTSGFDNIFYYGIKVGKVIKILEEETYKTAIVEPYVKIKSPDFFYVVDVDHKK